MCGISGINKRNTEFISKMLDALYHRGPDEEGVYADEDISLGVRRLSIIDLTTGSQPIYNEDKSLVVICNGEIYNFRSLREELIKKGHHFHTDSDTEALVHLYEENGRDCLRHIKGMFAFALWDRNRKTLFIARDRFGIKPLYYYNKDGIFAFASEAKALLKLPFINRELNTNALNLYLSLEYVPSPYSIWKDIYKLRPAHYMILKDNNLEIGRYWDLADKEKHKKISYADARGRLEELLNNSVKEHLISDVPLGIFLSGGIDSSILTGLAEKHYGQNLSTFSIGFKEKSFDESHYALSVSKHFGTKHYNYMFGIEDFTDNFYKIAGFMDEPFADLSIFPTYTLSSLSREHIKVALSGEGGDELFMGYPTYIAHKYISLFNRLPKKILKFSTRAVNNLPVSSEYFSLDFKLKQFVKGLNQTDPVLRHLAWMGAFSNDEKSTLLSEKFKKDSYVDPLSDSAFINTVMRGKDIKPDYKRIQYLDIRTYLSEDLLVKSDRASMFSSMEVRVPYLDHELAEFIWRLDHKFIYQKKLLKEMAKGLVPREILNRRKKGFPIPFSKWLKEKKFFDIIKEFFDKDFIEKQGMFNYGYVDSLLRKHLSGREDCRKKIGVYLMFQAWFKYQ
jgi:asparagine synthase (glutamine-hydrolysing)